MEQIERIEWDTPATWDPAVITEADYAKCHVGNPGKTRKRKIKNLLCAFDIETSHTPLPGREEAHLYHWQLQIGLHTKTIHGRTWDDLRLMLTRIRQALDDHDKLVIYVHNLSFEWVHLRTVYDFQPEEVFAVSSRHILKATMYDGAIELRCSYLLTNMGLGAWTAKMHVAHPKTDSEAYDHNQIRYPWDELAQQEQIYCRNDVLGLCEALQAQMERDHDTLETIPMTSTGYVRRDCKKVMQRVSYYTMRNVQPSLEVYQALREEFRGGDTHANRAFAGQIVPGVRSMDRSSSYPDVLVNCKFPMTEFRRWIRLTDTERIRLTKLDRALLMRVRFYNLHLRNPLIGDPPLSASKCRNIYNDAQDNGRILCAACLETTITDLDFRIYEQAYVWEGIEYIDCWQAGYDWLPDPLRQLVILYYKRKTELKGVQGQELFYDLAKALLNAIYGMMAQDPCKASLVWHPESCTFETSEEDVEKLLIKSRRGAYRSYSWGCWTTSWARLRLWEGIYGDGDPEHPGVGRDYVYGDTDSIKYVGEHNIDWYNRQRIADSKASGAYATDPKGKIHYMGVFEEEHPCRRFITWGAKKYAYELDDSGEVTMITTIAGVNKIKGALELKAHGGLEVLKPGFIFREAGGTESIYNDFTKEEVIIDGHKLELGPNIYIKPSTYKLGVTQEYGELIGDPESYLEFLADERNFDYIYD